MWFIFDFLSFRRLALNKPEILKRKFKKKLSMNIYLLPNLLTTGNMLFGFLAVIYSIQGQFIFASYCIVAAAIFDLLDGRLARLTRSTSQFGAEYDSLCDLISFGMAPALLLYFWALQPFGRIGIIASFFYVVCAALRLARFNVQANVIEKNYFQGLPSPVAAGIVASGVMAYNDLNWLATKNYSLLLLTFLLGFTMVSTFRYRSFKDLDLKQRMPFSYLVMAVLIFAVIGYWPEVMLFVLFLIYTLLGVIYGVLKWGKPPRKLKPNVYFPEQFHLEADLTEDEE